MYFRMIINAHSRYLDEIEMPHKNQNMVLLLLADFLSFY